jgi:hypothetical protein
VVGAFGLWRLSRSSAESPAPTAWVAFCVALISTAAGSAFYHWAPDNAALVADRIPIAWACAALLCAFLGERVNPRWAALPALSASVVVATGAVAYWWFTEQRGLGDLRPYLYVQFLPMLLVPAGLWLRLPPRHVNATPASAWWAVLGLYALAKVMELGDGWLLGATGITSGHTLKHLFAAAAGAWIVAAVTGLPAAAGQPVRNQLR